MDKQKSIIIAVLVIALTFSIFATTIPSVFAANTYVLNSDCPQGSVGVNTITRHTARTNNLNAMWCEFKWTKPDGSQVIDYCQTTLNGQYREAVCPPRTLDKLGEWRCQVTFRFSKYSGNIHTCDHDCRKTYTTCYKYELVCNPPCGSDVALNTIVTSTAKTTNSEIYKVKFTWTNPAGVKTTYTDTTREWTGEMDGGKKVYIFTSTKTLNVIGDWNVKAEFIDQQSSCRCNKDVILACRVQNFQVVPEIPMLGTVGASIAMLGGLAFKIKRKKA